MSQSGKREVLCLYLITVLMVTFRETILARLDERNQREHAFHEIILASE